LSIRARLSTDRVRLEGTEFLTIRLSAMRATVFKWKEVHGHSWPARDRTRTAILDGQSRVFSARVAKAREAWRVLGVAYA
jgi:hypothetical protein